MVAIFGGGGGDGGQLGGPAAPFSLGLSCLKAESDHSLRPAVPARPYIAGCRGCNIFMDSAAAITIYKYYPAYRFEYILNSAHIHDYMLETR